MSTINFLIRIDWIRVTFIIHLLSSEFQYEILPVNKKIPWKRVSIHWKNPSGTVNQFSSVQSLSCVWLFATPWLQHARLSHPSPISRAYSNSCPLCWWCHPTISSSVIPFSSTFNLSQHQGLFKWVSSSHQVANVLEFQLQHQSFQWTPRTDFL